MERAIIDGAAEAIITIASSGTVELCNLAAIRLFGYDHSEIIGRDFRALLGSPLARQDSFLLQNLLREQQTRVSRVQLTGSRKNGSTFPMELVGSRIEFDKQRLFVGIIRDISHSHEIRAYIDTLLGNLGRLLETSLSSEQRSLAETAVEAGKAILAITAESPAWAGNDSGYLNEGSHSKLTHQIVPARRGRILLAEDSQVNQILTVAMLEKAGYRVDIVSNGLEAVQALRALPYELVLMDVAMPALDGFQATAQIRRLPGQQNRVPIIAITGDSHAQVRERCSAVGMNDCLTKPLDQAQLLAVVERWLPAATSFPEAGSGPALDWEILRQLETDTDPALLDRAVSLFINETNNRLRHIGEALASKDWTRVKWEAHALKSSAGTFGVKRLHQHALRLDEACQQSDWETALTLAKSIDEVAIPDLEMLTHHYGQQR